MEYGPKIGLDSVWVAPLTDGSDTVGGTPVWGTPVQLAGAAKMTGKPNGSLATDYGDNGPFWTGNTRGNLQADLELIDVNPAVLSALLGQTKTNGIVQENILDQSPYYALGFRVWIGGSDTGSVDANKRIYEYFWYLKGKFTIPDQGATTKKATLSPEHTTLNAEFVKLVSNNLMCTHARTNDPDVSAATITNWFNAPVYTAPYDGGALSVVIAKSTTKATFTFTKVGGGTFNIATASAVVGTSVIVSKGGVIQTGAIAWTGQGTATVVGTFTPTTAFGTNDVTFAITPDVKDSYGVACAATVTTISYP